MAELRDRIRRAPVRTLRTVVLKIGGEHLLEEVTLATLAARVRSHWIKGDRVVVVHGHGPAGADDPAMTRSAINATLVSRLVAEGLLGLGQTGIDVGFVQAGRCARVDVTALRRLLEEGAVPVIAPVVMGEDGRATEVAPETLAQALAAALTADTLELLGDAAVPTRQVERGRVEELLGRRDLDHDLRRRLEAARQALLAGTRDVRLAGIERVPV
jgi:acetylglutamate kinase